MECGAFLRTDEFVEFFVCFATRPLDCRFALNGIRQNGFRRSVIVTSGRDKCDEADNVFYDGSAATAQMSFLSVNRVFCVGESKVIRVFNTFRMAKRHIR